MQEEEAGPPVVIGGGAAAPSGGATPRTPRGVPSVCDRRGAAGGTATSRDALTRAPPAPAPSRVPARPTPAPAPVVHIQRGPFPSRGAHSAGGAVCRRAPSPLPVSSREKEYKDDVDAS